VSRHGDDQVMWDTRLGETADPEALIADVEKQEVDLSPASMRSRSVSQLIRADVRQERTVATSPQIRPRMVIAPKMMASS
jgi:hypothetical protein